MAVDKTIPPAVQKLSVPEAQALADRLLSRSLSSLFVASPEVRRDLCLASRSIRSLLPNPAVTPSDNGVTGLRSAMRALRLALP
jgi:hypothetical protein